MRVPAAIVVAVALTSVSARAEADPIQTVYRINVQSRCTFAGNTEVCEGFHSSFALALTFDGGVVSSHGDDLDRTMQYGEPTVSGMPLPLRDDFPPLGEPSKVAAERARFSTPEQAWVRESGVTIRQVASVNGSDYHRDFSLIASGEYRFAPALDAGSFAQFLGTASFRQFGLSDSVERSDGGFELLSYAGRVSLESTATPEPGSLLLVAAGMFSGLFRRRARTSRAY